MQTYFQIHISGNVQDVFFRDTAKQTADTLGVCGIIRNESDGTVYAEVSGDPGAIEKFIAWCNVGPKAARVSNVAVVEKSGPFPYADFAIAG